MTVEYLSHNTVQLFSKLVTAFIKLKFNVTNMFNYNSIFKRILEYYEI